MILTIQLTPEEEARLNAAASSELLEPADLIRKWVSSLPLQRGPGTGTHGDTPSYGLLQETLAVYHALLDKKFAIGLTVDEEERLSVLAQTLGDADLSAPVEAEADAAAEREHCRQIVTLDALMEILRNADQRYPARSLTR